MKKFLFPVIAAAAFLIAGCVLYFQVTNAVYTEKYDATQMRRILRAAEGAFPDVSEADFSGFDIPFSVLDKNGEAVYKSDLNVSASLDEALMYSDPSMSFSQGTVIFSPRLVSGGAGQKEFRQRLGIEILAAFIAGGALTAAICGYIYIKILRPFMKLNRFAKEVAAGNLDFPLEMDRGHIFGEFTESFDLMRSELAAARQREFLASQEKKEMIASLSHDIRTPVTSIRVVSEFLSATEKDKDALERLETIREKTDQIEQLVSNLFHSALEELDAFSVNMEEHYSHELAKAFKDADFYGELSETRDIPECLICYDTLRLSQIAGNLMYNAFKYGASPVKLVFFLKEDILEVTLTDSGKGVPEDELPFIFNKYYRGKNAEGKNGGGLGLAICRSLMEKMGGSIDAVNRPDGFCVILRFPLAG